MKKALTIENFELDEWIRRLCGTVGLLLVLSACEGTLLGGAEKGAAGKGDGGLQGSDAETPALDCSVPNPGPRPLRRLTHTQYDNTLAALIGDDSRPSKGFPAEARALNFNGIADAQVASELLVEGWKSAAEQAGARAVGDDVVAFLGCAPTTPGCVEGFVRDFTSKAYRRPVTEEEVTGLMDVFGWGVAELTVAEGVRMVIEVVLQSPDFLYRPEFGAEEVAPGVRRVSSREMATRLSYFLTDSMPDDELMAAAARDELRTEEQIATHVDRLMTGSSARQIFSSFHRQWLHLDGVHHLVRDPNVYPGYDDSIPELLVEETHAFVEHVIFESTGTLQELLTADYTLANAQLAAYYGLSGPGGSNFEVVELPQDRSGLLTQGGLLAHHAHALSTSPVHRGKFIRESFFCQIPPPPPNDLIIEPPNLDPNLTTRERFAQHSEDPECASCHQLMDPIGLAFEAFDASGRHRETENGLAIDVSGELVATDVDGPIQGVDDLGNKLASSEDVAQCMGRQWLRFAMGRSETPEDACSLARVSQEFVDSGFDLRSLARAMTRMEAFLYLREVEGS